MGINILEVENLNKSYQMGEVTVDALNSVSLTVEEGDFVVILGPSGSGKSTLLNLIGGMDHPTSGKILYRGKSIESFSDKELTGFRRNAVGFVFQFYNLLGNLTAKENVELATEIIDEHLDVEQIMTEVGLSDRMGHFPAQLSGGEQQRVAIARAVCKNPDLLLCDEPTGALDYKTGLSILKLLVEINRKYGKTILVITHNVAIAEVGNKIIKMLSGTIVESYVNDNPIDPEKVGW